MGSYIFKKLKPKKQFLEPTNKKIFIFVKKNTLPISGLGIWNSSAKMTSFHLLFCSIMKKLFFFFIIIQAAEAQFIENFTDGNISQNPKWKGDTTHFIINASQQLQLNNTSASGGGAFYSSISTPFTLLEATMWEFWVRIPNPTTANFPRIYLVTDTSYLLGDLNAYFVSINANKQIILQKQTGTTFFTLLSSGSSTVTCPCSYKIQVTRSHRGEWKLFTGVANNYTLQGTTTDSSFTSSKYFGVYTRYSSGNKSAYSFDSISIMTKLRIQNIEIINQKQIRITFNQPYDSNTTLNRNNYSFTPSITIDSLKKYTLQSIDMYVDSIRTGNNAFSIHNIKAQVSKDFDTLTTSFIYNPLRLLSVHALSPQKITLFFNQEVDSISANNIAHYSVHTLGMPVNIIISAHKKEITLIFSNSFAPQFYSLSVQNIFNEEKNSQLSTNTTFEYFIPLIIDSLQIKSNRSLQLFFNEAVDTISAKNFSHYTVNNNIGTPIDIVLYPNKREATLLFDSVFERNTYELSVQGLKNSNQKHIVPSPTVLNFTYNPLRIDSFRIFENKKILLSWNQNITNVNKNSFVLDNNFYNPDTIFFQNNAKNKLVLSFSQNFANTHYTLSIKNIANEKMNAQIDSLVLSFAVNAPSSYKDLWINELFSDPTGTFYPDSLVLPTHSSAEFIEIFNNTSHSINLYNFKISTANIGNYTIHAGEYVILCPTAFVNNYQLFGKTIGVANFPSLTNTGRKIELRDNFNNLIDSITYRDSFYGDSKKQDGGWTLEFLNKNSACSPSTNWRASFSKIGGTPGSINSWVNALDTNQIAISQIQFIDSIRFHIIFSQEIDLENSQNWSITIHSHSIKTIQKASQNSIQVTLDTPIISEKKYTITYKNIKKCNNNAESGSYSFSYDKKPPLLKNISLVSLKNIVLLFDESLKETTAENEQNFSLSHPLLFFNPLPSSAILQSDKKSILLSFSHNLLLDETYTINIVNISDSVGNVIPFTTKKIKIKQEIDTAFVEGENYLRVIFQKKISQNSLSQLKNYSIIHDTINPVSIIQMDTSSKNIRLIFSRKFPENIFFFLKVRSLTDISDSSVITPEFPLFYDTKAPKIIDILAPNSRQLSLSFDEPIWKHSGETSANYTLLNRDKQPVSALLKNNTQVILTFLEKIPPEIEQELSIKNIEDIHKNKMTTTSSKPFFFDTIPPRLLYSNVYTQKTLRFQFSEPLKQYTRLSVFIENAPAHSFKILEYDSSKIEITLQNPLSIKHNIPLLFTNISDRFANTKDSITSFIDNSTIQIADAFFHSDSTVVVKFSKLFLRDSIKSSLILSLNDSFQILSTNIFSAEAILFTYNKKCINGTTYPFVIQNIWGEDGIKQQKMDTINLLYNSRIKFIKIEKNDIVQIQFTNPLSYKNLKKTYFKLFPQNISPQHYTLHEKDSSLVRLFFTDHFLENIPLFLQLDSLSDRWNRKIPNQRIRFLRDTQSPYLSNVKPINQQELVITFNEEVSFYSASSLNNYIVSQQGFPKTISPLNAREYKLFFDPPYSHNTPYTLIVKNISDISGNILLIDSASFIFSTGNAPKKGDIFITEIMFDPSPPIGLPDAEYLEIYNRSSQTISLHNCTLQINNTNISLPFVDMLPQEYCIVAATNYTSLLQQYGKILGVPSFSLSNAGGTITLKKQDTIMDRVMYSPASLPKENQDGGYSLEIQEIGNECLGSKNWTASRSITGGTPGKQNSVNDSFLDSIPPTIKRIEVINDSSILIFISEIIRWDKNSSPILKPSIPIQYATPSGFTDSFRIIFSEKIKKQTQYLLSLSEIYDCKNNMGRNIQTYFFLPERGDKDDVIINEILFNPNVNGVDFVELKNISEKYINLAGWKIGNQEGERSANFRSVSDSSFILEPNSFVTFTNAPEVLQMQYPLGKENTFLKVTLPSYNDDKGGVFIKNAENITVDSLYYDEKMHSTLLKETEGVSLERIFAHTSTNERLNWSSATESVGFATPGYDNSRNGVLHIPEKMIEIEPKAFVPCAGCLNNSTTITFHHSLQNSKVYAFIYNVDGIKIKTLSNGSYLSASSFFTWDGTDESNLRVPVGLYILYCEFFDVYGKQVVVKETIAIGF